MTETVIRTATCPHADCPWELDIYDADDELVEADHRYQHELAAERA